MRSFYLISKRIPETSVDFAGKSQILKYIDQFLSGRVGEFLTDVSHAIGNPKMNRSIRFDPPKLLRLVSSRYAVACNGHPSVKSMVYAGRFHFLDLKAIPLLKISPG